ncbi:hypothetical protein ACHAWF_017286 [Thalassiosira exigua]
MRKFGFGHEEIDAMKALSRRLRGRQENPSDIIPEVHNMIKGQLDSVQTLHKMYEDGDDASFAASIRTLFGEESTNSGLRKNSRELVAQGHTEEDLAPMKSFDWDDVPDSQIVELFKPSDLMSDHVEPLQHLDGILDDFRLILQEMKTNPRRHLKDDLPKGPRSSRQDFPSGTNRMPHWTKAGNRPKLPKLKQFGDNDDVASQNHRRLNGLPPVCTTQCAPTDESCLCERLAGCVQQMGHYDLSLLFSNGYIEEDTSSSSFAEFTVSDDDLRLFNVGDDAFSTFETIMNTSKTIDATSSSETCTKFLEQFHQSCDPLSGSTCSTENVQSFQLSVNEVCDATYSPTKLLFSAIGNKFDGYASTDGKCFHSTSLLIQFTLVLTHMFCAESLGLEDYITTCGQDRVAFQSCRTFIEAFELLYQGRNESEYPFQNPMRSNPAVPIGEYDEGTILFPTQYKFMQDIYGVPYLASPDMSAISTSGADIQLASTTNMCLDSGYGGNDAGNIYMQKCLGKAITRGVMSHMYALLMALISSFIGDDNQMFYYDSETYQIKQNTQAGPTKCLDYNAGDNGNVWLNECYTSPPVLNQKWKYNPITLELNTFQDNNCLHWNETGNGNVFLQGCNGDESQRYRIPKQMLPGISTNTLHQIRIDANQTMCMDSGYGGTGGTGKRNIYMNNCIENSANQKFNYNASTQQITQYTPDGLRCVDYDSESTEPPGNVYMNNCLEGEYNQKWMFNSKSRQLMTFQGNGYNCLEWYLETPGNNLQVVSCTGNYNQQFLLPFQWNAVMSSTSLFSSVMVVISGTNYCLDFLPSNKNVYLNINCINTDQNQNWFYNSTSRQVQNQDMCLDTNDNSMLYLNSACNSTSLSQKWYYEPYSRQLRQLSGDKCFDADAGTENCLPGTDLINGNCPTMNSCNNGQYQQFLVPLTWSPAANLDELRVVQNGGKCMDAEPDSNNNVWMADCQTGNLNQDFHFDSRTLAIKHIGMCLDYDSSNYNVFLNTCDKTDEGQQWVYDSSSMHLYTNGKGSDFCLNWNTDDGSNNLYLNDGCDGTSNEQWMIPSLWLPYITENERQGSPSEFQVAGYHTRPIPTGLWNGQWNTEKQGYCSVDLLQDVLDACDESMSLLVGEYTSLGTLSSIAKEPDSMPGSCCVDNPATSQWFGYYDCINDRPEPGEPGYSQSFETFASSLVIADATDQTQCGNTRQGLGYSSDWQFDTDV